MKIGQPEIRIKLEEVYYTIFLKITYDIFLDTKQKVCAKIIFYKVRFCMRILIFTSFLSRWV